MTIRLSLFITQIFSILASGQTTEFNFDFRKLSVADTLFITSKIKNSGKLSEHCETIKIYSDGLPIAIISREDSDIETSTTTNTVTLGHEAEVLILDYIYFFALNPAHLSKVPTDNKITFHEKVIFVRDEDSSWLEFVKLYRTIFRK